MRLDRDSHSPGTRKGNDVFFKNKTTDVSDDTSNLITCFLQLV